MRARAGLAAAAATATCLGHGAAGCAPAARAPRRGVAHATHAAALAGLDLASVEQQLRAAAYTLHRVFAREGAEGLLRLRLRPEEVREVFTADAALRIERMPRGLYPSSAERRWRMYGVLADSPLVGFCARGLRQVEADGPEGFHTRAIVVDRLLLVGSEPHGLWGAWVEGLLLTPVGWRLLPTVPFERQVDAPRRDHTDVVLWDCDFGVRPERGVPL